MKKLFLLVFMALGTLFFLAPSGKAFADVANWQKSVMIEPSSTTDFASSTFDTSVSNAIADGANYITLVIPVSQTNIYSTDVQPAYNTPTDQSLASAVAYIHAHGASVAFTMHDNPDDGQWRAFINPTDRTTWFANYGIQLNHFATLAQSLGVQEFVIGTELSDMTMPSVNSTNTANWISLIQTVRGEYKGIVTYSAQHDGYMADDQSLGFWPELDYIGISAYYGLGSGDESVATIESNWNNWQSDIQTLSARYSKPVLFTEIGYVSQTNALADPGAAYLNGGPVDDTLQANAYQALFSYWNNYSYMQGVALWGWSSNSSAGGPSDLGYTPQNKPAEQIMKQNFASSAPTTTITVPVSTPTASSYNIVATPSTAADTVGSPENISTSVSANAGISNVIVDVEVYNSQGQRVYQTYYPGQTLGTTASTFTSSFTPTVADTYSIKVGVFTSDWSGTLDWNNSAGSFTASTATPVVTTTTPVATTTATTTTTSSTPVTTTTTPTTTSTATSSTTSSAVVSGPVDIWWPGSSVAVSGVQPFKALIDGADVNNYVMYWQVDNGVLNAMANNYTPLAHKESLVDLTNWNWNSNGQYTVNFIAKDLSGNVISSQSVVITVTP